MIAIILVCPKCMKIIVNSGSKNAQRGRALCWYIDLLELVTVYVQTCTCIYNL